MDIAFMLETLQTLLAALPMTLALFVLSVFFGGLLALVIVWMRVSGLGQFGFIRYSFLWPALREPFVCAVLSLALCTAGYTAEIFRFGLRAIPAKEIEAARSVGMSGFLLTRRILAPVAFRHALPAYSTEVVMMVKSTALASLVTVWEVTGVAQRLISQTYRTMEIFLCAAAIYLVLNFLILQAMALLEYKLTPHRRAAPLFPVPQR
jgi:octopine/nopaline transport system permease protein